MRVVTPLINLPRQQCLSAVLSAWQSLRAVFAVGRKSVRRAFLASALTGAALLTASPAKADVWGYVDGSGVAHFSASRLDERYELFCRGGDNFAVGKGLTPRAEVANSPSSAGSISAPPKLLTYFDVSPGYKAVRYLLREASLLHGIDYELLQALIATESGFNTHAVSPRGAVGLMQLIPPTAQRYGVRAEKNEPVEKKLTDPRTNIKAGAQYLSDLINMFPGQLELAIAAYNAGEGAVQRAGNQIPNYPETRQYVKTVMALYGHLKPPVAVVQARQAGRVRMEMMGGVPSARAGVLAVGQQAPDLSKALPALAVSESP